MKANIVNMLITNMLITNLKMYNEYLFLLYSLFSICKSASPCVKETISPLFFVILMGMQIINPSS